MAQHEQQIILIKAYLYVYVCCWSADSEQQQLLHAAQIIQNAFRKYKVSVRVDMGASEGVDDSLDWGAWLTAWV